MRPLLIAAIVAGGIAGPAFGQPAPMPVPDASGPAARLSAELEASVRSVLEAFIDGENTPAEQLAFFADRVHYYDQGVVGKNAIAKDIGYTMRRWPWRNNRLVEIEYLKPLPEDDKVFVSYVVDYEVSNASRTVHGRARYGAVISGLQAEPRIEGIFENVTARKRISPFR